MKSKEKKKSSFRDRVKSDVQRQKDANKRFGYLNLPEGVEVFKLEIETDIEIDIIPYVVSDPKHLDGIPVGTEWYKRPFLIHRNVGYPASAYVCLQTVGKRCPICEYRDLRQKEGAGKEELANLKNSYRNLYNIVPKSLTREYKKIETDIVYVMDQSWKAFQERLNKDLKRKDEYNDFPDLQNGYTLAVSIAEGQTGGKNTYPIADRIDFNEREEQYEEDMIDQAVDLDKVLKILSYDELNAIFLAEPAEDEDGEEETTHSHHVRTKDKKTSSKRTTKKVEDDDEEEVEEEEQSMQRSSKTTKKPTKSTKSRRDEKEDDDETELTWEVLSIASQRKLSKLIISEELDIDPDDFEEDELDDLRKAVANEMGIKIPKKPVSKKDDDEEDEDKVETSKKKSRTKPTSKSEQECPHGHEFGVDTDDFKECAKCKIWEDCIEEKEKEE